MELKREIVFQPAYDKRDPDPAKNYGVHGVNIIFYLKGKQGVVQFEIYTRWHVPHVQKEIDERPPTSILPYLSHSPMAYDLGYYRFKHIYGGQKSMNRKCAVIGSEFHYYDGSTLGAERVFDILRIEGDEGVWRELEKYYKDTFSQ